jgi:hypothetical protein
VNKDVQLPEDLAAKNGLMVRSWAQARQQAMQLLCIKTAAPAQAARE